VIPEIGQGELLDLLRLLVQCVQVRLGLNPILSDLRNILLRLNATLEPSTGEEEGCPVPLSPSELKGVSSNLMKWLPLVLISFKFFQAASVNLLFQIQTLHSSLDVALLRLVMERVSGPTMDAEWQPKIERLVLFGHQLVCLDFMLCGVIFVC